MKHFRKFRSVISIVAAAACVFSLLSPEAVLAAGELSVFEAAETRTESAVTESEFAEVRQEAAPGTDGAEAETAEVQPETAEKTDNAEAETAGVRSESAEKTDSADAEAGEVQSDSAVQTNDPASEAADAQTDTAETNAAPETEAVPETAWQTNEADSETAEVPSEAAPETAEVPSGTAPETEEQSGEVELEELEAEKAGTEQTVGASVFEYVSVGGGISVTGYTGTATAITIPSSIGGSTVVSIGEEAFRQTAVSSVTLPATLTSLGTKCFYGCENLRSINLGSCTKLQTVGEGAFSLCKSLTTVRIPDSVTVIGSDAFFCCSQLTSLTIGSKVKVIEMYAFGMCGKLTSVTLPSSVKTVEMYAFSQCENLSSINLGSVVTIGNYAFAFAAPTTLSVPATCTSIGVGAFHDCDNLTKVNLREGTASIGRIAFANCPGLSSQIIPDSVTTIGDGAFGCNWGWDSEIVVGMSASPDEEVGSLTEAEDPELWVEELKSLEPSEETVGSGEYITPRSGFTISAYRTDGAARTYALKYGFTFKRISKPISETVISGIKSSYCYTGKVQKPAPTVKDGSTTLKAGTDYTLSYSGNTNLGTATITLTGKGNYKGTTKKTFRIIAYALSGGRISAKTASSTYAYTGYVRKPGVTVTFNGTKLTAGTDYTVAYKNNRNPGTATITLTGKGRFRLTRTLTFRIALTVPTVTGAVKKSPGTMRVTWKKYNLARGYQVKIARGQTSKTYTCGGTSTLSKTISGLATGKTWRVYVRSYRKIGTKFYYSDWSGVKYVKV